MNDKMCSPSTMSIRRSFLKYVQHFWNSCSSFVLRTYLSITMKMIAIHQLSSTWYCDEQGNAHFSECKQKAKEGFDDPRIYFAAAELDGFPPRKEQQYHFFPYHNFLLYYATALDARWLSDSLSTKQYVTTVVPTVSTAQKYLSVTTRS